MKTIIISTLLGLSLLAGSAMAQTIYRSIDDDTGKVSYSDRPKFADEEIELRVQPTNRAKVTEQVAANQERYAAAADDRKSAAEEQAMLTEEAGKVAADRRANCDMAKGQAEQYATARRLYRDLPNGERDYLNDKELTQARVDARRQVDEWCSG
ncbi:MAG: DUF4124 domain-containing protein [Gammaproteobacteria bacterium]